MINPDQEQIKQEEFNRAYRRLAKRIRPDKFRKGEYGKFLNDEAGEIFKELENIKSGKRRKNGGQAILSTWEEKLRALREFSDEIDDFVSRAERKKQPEPDPDSGNGVFMTDKKFKEKYKDFFTTPRFDIEFSAVYVSGYDENTGKVKIKVTPSGGKLEERELSSLDELDNILKEVLKDKTKTFREIFDLDSFEKDEKDKEKSWNEFKEKYKNHEDFLNKKESYFDNDDNWIHFSGFGVDGVEIRDGLSSGKRRKVSVDEFEELLKKYKKKVGAKRKMEDVEKERAEKAQEEINKQKFDHYRDPGEWEKKQKEQEKTDEAAEYEMGDKIHREKKREDEKEEVEASESEMEERIRRENEKEKEKDEEDELKENEMNKLHLEALVENARRDYAKKDYEVTGALSKLRNFFGGKFRTTPDDIGDRKEMCARYKSSLKDYLEYRLDEMKGKGFPEKEMQDLYKELNYTEKCELFDAHTSAKAKVVEEKWGKTPGWIAEKFTGFSDWHRKQNWKVKMGVGIAASVLGLGLPNRIISGSVTGAGVMQVMEARRKGKQLKEFENDQKDIFENLDSIESEDEKLNSLQGWLEAEINGLDKTLAKEKRDRLYARSAGITAAALIGSGVVAGAVKGALHELGLDKYIFKTVSGAKEYLGFSFVPTGVKAGVEIPDGGGKAGVSAETGKVGANVENSSGSVKVGGATVENVKPGAGTINTENLVKGRSGGWNEPGEVNNNSVSQRTGGWNEPNRPKVSGLETAGKGNDSVWKMIDHQLQGRYGNAYSAMSPEQKANLIDTLKNQVAKSPKSFGLKNIDTLKVGQKVDFSRLFEDGGKVHKMFDHAQHLKPEQIQNIAKNNKTIADWMRAHPGERLTSPKVEEILSRSKAGATTTHSVSGATQTTTHSVPGEGTRSAQYLPNEPKVSAKGLAEAIKGHKEDIFHLKTPQGYAGAAEKGVYDQAIDFVVGKTKGGLSTVLEKYYETNGMTHEAAVKKAHEAANEYAYGRGLKPEDIAVEKGTEMKMTPDEKILDILNDQAMEGGTKKGDGAIMAGVLGFGAVKAVEKFSKGGKERFIREFLMSHRDNLRLLSKIKKEIETVKNTLGEVADKEEKLSDLYAQHNSVLKETFDSLRRDVVGESKSLNSLADLEKISATDFLKNKTNSKENIVRIYKHFSTQYDIEPKEGENLKDWTRRFVVKIIKETFAVSNTYEKAV